jgi:2',3'-cyclic-nucleotide 2'-phosphodiesterase (5'-nucleotidase family)
MRPFAHRLAGGVLLALLVSPAAAEPVTIKILQVNDWDRIQESDGRGGYARFVSVLKQENAAAEDVLLVHAGDAISPSLLSGFDKGAHMVELLNRVPLDVFVLGNHEFDFGPDVAKERIGETRFPVVNSNVTDQDGSLLKGTVESRIIEVAGYRLGFFGLTTPDTSFLASPGYAGFRPLVETAQAVTEKLRREGADLVLLVTHAGFGDDLLLMRESGADLIFTGHDHDLRVIYDGGAGLSESASQADYVMAVELTLDRVKRNDKEQLVWRPAYRTIDTGKVAPDAEAAALVQTYEDRLSKELDVVIGTTATDLDSTRPVIRDKEAAIGNLFADAIREAVGADVAIANGGGIRANKQYPASTRLTRRDILSELPFGNKTVKLELKGKDLLAALENGFSQAGEGAGRFPQVSGMTVTFDPALPPGGRVVEVTIGGRKLDKAATYTLATNDYIAGGGDNYTALKAGRNLIDPQAAKLMASQVIDYVAARGTVAPKVEGRIVRLD